MAKILFCAVDAGACGALAPVANLLRDAGHAVVWVTQIDSVGASRLRSLSTHIIADTETEDEISFVLQEFRPDAVVAGVSGNGPDLALHLSQAAMRRSIPVVKVLDFYGTGMPHEKNFAPTRLCVLDEPSIGYEARMRGMSPKLIVATGAPQFDALLSVRQRAHRGEGELILFVGPSSEARVFELVEDLEDSLGVIRQQVRLGLLLHPKSRPETYVQSLTARLAHLQSVQLIHDDELRRMGDNDEIINAADLVVGATSAEIVKACYLRRPTLSIVADGGSNHEILRSRGIERMPTSTCGASLHAETAEQVKEIFSQLYPPNGSATALGHQMLKQMEGNQARFYSLDGKNTKRTADVVEGVLRRTQ